MKTVTVMMSATALKKHSVVYQGSGPEGEAVSFYVTNAILRKLGIELAGDENPNDLPNLNITLEVS